MQVVQYTFDEARQGRTPNPDIMCNSRIKFGMFYDYVGKYFANIATGKAKQGKAKKACKSCEPTRVSAVSLSCGD